MLELLCAIGVCWLFLKFIKLSIKLTWGAAKIAATILFSLAFPMLVGCILFAGGLLILVPALLAVAAFCILKICI